VAAAGMVSCLQYTAGLPNMQQILLVDFENVPKIDLGAVPPGVVVPFFFGAAQKSVPTEFLKAALKLGERFLPIDIAGAGRNALDFHIAFYLGEYLAANRSAHCVILSRDKGFDPLVKHLQGRGYAVRRAATLEEAFPRARQPSPGRTKAPAVASLDNALAWLTSMDKSKRPKKRPALAAHLHSHFAGKLSQADVARLLERMISDGHLSEAAGKLNYHL
jgi:hypothetical protein